jgi:hypothetical protein
MTSEDASSGALTAVSGRRVGGYVVDWLIFMSVMPAILLVATADATSFSGHIQDMTTCEGPLCSQLRRSGGEVAQRPGLAAQPVCDSVSQLAEDGRIDLEYGGRFGCITLEASGEELTVVWREGATFLAAAAWLAYLVVVLWLVQGRTGATVGKLMFGIRTVDAEGGPPGLGRQLVRGVGGVVDAAPFCFMPLLPLVGLITMLATKDHRRVGDMLGGSYVVRATAAGSSLRIDDLTVAPHPERNSTAG